VPHGDARAALWQLRLATRSIARPASSPSKDRSTLQALNSAFADNRQMCPSDDSGLAARHMGFAVPFAGASSARVCCRIASRAPAVLDGSGGRIASARRLALFDEGLRLPTSAGVLTSPHAQDATRLLAAKWETFACQVRLAPPVASKPTGGTRSYWESWRAPGGQAREHGAVLTPYTQAVGPRQGTHLSHKHSEEHPASHPKQRR
jgi:hypothetical protein